jgi:hypothetical protein
MPNSAYLATGGIKLQATDDVRATMTLGAKSTAECRWGLDIQLKEHVERVDVDTEAQGQRCIEFQTCM